MMIRSFSLFLVFLAAASTASSQQLGQQRQRRNLLNEIDVDYCGPDSWYGQCSKSTFCNHTNDKNFCQHCPASVGDCNLAATSQRAIETCQKKCAGFASQGELCSRETPCRASESLYCEYLGYDDANGQCQPCKENFEDCLLLEAPKAQQSCLKDCYRDCTYYYAVDLDGVVHLEESSYAPSKASSPPPEPASASGPLSLCTFGQGTSCSPAASDDGIVCLMHHDGQTNLEDLVAACDSQGGVALLWYSNFTTSVVGQPAGYLGTGGPLADYRLHRYVMPVLKISAEAGTTLEESKLGLDTVVSRLGIDYCDKRAYCSDAVPCGKDEDDDDEEAAKEEKSIQDIEDTNICVENTCTHMMGAQASSGVWAREGDACSTFRKCAPSKFFCNQDSGNDSDEGVCKPCKDDYGECLLLATEASRESCLDCHLRCRPDYKVSLDSAAGDDQVEIPNGGFFGAPSSSASGPLADCSNLLLGTGENDLEANQPVCLFDISTAGSNMMARAPLAGFLVDRCQASGCVGALFFSSQFSTSQRHLLVTSLDATAGTVSVPVTGISFEDGNRLRSRRLGQEIRLTVQEEFCEREQMCSDEIPCIGRHAGMYCGLGGRCTPCPVQNEDPKAEQQDEVVDDETLNPFGCFNDAPSSLPEASWQHPDLRVLRSCAETCSRDSDVISFASADAMILAAASEQDVSLSLNFKFEDDSSVSLESCLLCEHQVLNPEQQLESLFGRELGFSASCGQVNELLRTLEVVTNDVSSSICQEKLPALREHCGGCAAPPSNDPTTSAAWGQAVDSNKSAVLEWLPRVAALLSIMGSLYIVADIFRSSSPNRMDAWPNKRPSYLDQPPYRYARDARHLHGQVLAALSVADIVASSAMAFTVLPSTGNGYDSVGAGCYAQGFFVNFGTNLAWLFSLVLIGLRAWLGSPTAGAQRQDESFAKNNQATVILLGVPIFVAATFALAGLPSYGDMAVWCDNTALWWPAVPGIVAWLLLLSVIIYSTQKMRRARALKQTPVGPCLATAGYYVGFNMSLIPYMMLRLYYRLMVDIGSPNVCYGVVAALAAMASLHGLWNAVVYRACTSRPPCEAERVIADAKSAEAGDRPEGGSIVFSSDSSTHVTDDHSGNNHEKEKDLMVVEIDGDEEGSHFDGHQTLPCTGRAQVARAMSR